MNLNPNPLSLTTIGSTPNANGASLLTNSVLQLQPANASFGGIITTTAQNIVGSKAFTDKMAVGFATTPAISTVQIGATINAFDTNAKVAVNSENPSMGALQYFEGFDSQVQISGSYDTLNGQLVGVFGTVDYASSVVTTGEMIGVWGWASADAVDVGSLIGVVGFARRNGAGTVTNASALHSQGFFDGSGTITRGFGLYLQNSDGDATSAYQIFSEGTSPDTSEHFYTSNPGTDPFVLTSKNRVGIGLLAPPYLFSLQSIGSTSGYVSAGSVYSDYQGSGPSSGFRLSATRTAGSGMSAVLGYDSFTTVSGGTGTIAKLVAYNSLIQRTGGGSVTVMANFYADANSASGTALNTGFYTTAQASATLNTGYYAASFADANFPFYYAGTAGKQFVVTGAGQVGAGVSAFAFPTYKLQAGSSTNYLAGGAFGSVVYNTDTASPLDATVIYGSYSKAQKTTTAVNFVYGAYNEAWLTGTLGLSVEGVGTYGRMVPSHSSGTLAKAIGVVGEAVLISSGPITNVTSFHARARRDSGTSVVTEQYGLRIDELGLAAAADRYAISYRTATNDRFDLFGDASIEQWVEDTVSVNWGNGTNRALGQYVYTGKISNASITHIWGSYFDQELGGTLGATDLTCVNAVPYLYHSAGVLGTACGVYIEPVLDGVTGSVTNLIGIDIHHTLASGAWNVTNAYGIKIGGIAASTGAHFAILFDAELGGGNGSSWFVSGKARMVGWVEDSAHPSLPAYIEGFYYGAVHNTHATVTETTGGYVDSELFGSLSNLTLGALGLVGSVYWNKTGGTVAKAVGLTGDFYSDTATGTLTNLIGFETRYTFNSTPTITNQYGIKLATVNAATNNWAIYYGTGAFSVTGVGYLTSAGASFTALNTYFGVTSITAFAGGGQASATQLTGEVNFVTTVATTLDSVKLQVAVLGKFVTVFNTHATNTCNVYPASGAAIDALGTNTPYALLPGTSREFIAQTATQWYSR